MAHVEGARFRTREFEGKDGGARRSWEVRYYLVHGGKRLRQWKGGFATKAKAEKWLSSLSRDIQDPSWTPDGRKDDGEPVPTLGEFVEEYVQTGRASKRARSVEREALALGHFQRFVGGAKRIDTITARQVEGYLAKRREEGRAPGTLFNELTIIRTAFNAAVRWRLVGENPTVGIKKPKLPEKGVVFLEEEDQRALVAAARRISEEGEEHNSAKEAPYLWPLIVLALKTGLRRGELFNLRWQDVDFDAKRIRVTNSETFTTKSGHERTVGLHPEAAAVLAWWRDWFRAEAARAMERAADKRLHVQLRQKAETRHFIIRTTEPRPDRLVFPSFSNISPEGESMPLDNVNNSFKAALLGAFGVPTIDKQTGEMVRDKKGLPVLQVPKRYRIGLHAMRHTFAVMMARAGVPLAVLSRLLGHADLKTTQIYLRFYADEGADLVNRLPDTSSCGRVVAEIGANSEDGEGAFANG